MSDRRGDDEYGDTGLLLSVAGAIAVRNVNVALEAVDLRARPFSILDLAVRSAGVNQRQLADALRLNPSQIVAIVDDLVAAGLVERRPDPVDRRSRLVCATEKGLLRNGEARELADGALDLTFSRLDGEERATLRRLLLDVVATTDR